MPERIEYAGSVAVVGGPQFSFKRTIESGAYHKFQFELKQGTTRKIELGTSATNKLKLLAITSTEYDDEITFIIDAPTGTVAHKLDQPLLIAGTAGLELIGTTISSLEFKNAFTDKDVTINVVIVREP